MSDDHGIPIPAEELPLGQAVLVQHLERRTDPERELESEPRPGEGV